MSETSHVAVLGTGGTIATPVRAGHGHPELGADELIRPLAGQWPSGVTVEAQRPLNQPSAHHGTLDLAHLVDVVADTLARPEVAGAVVTHGTDTLEETAYLLDRAVPSEKPVAVTGAMRPPDLPGADGPANLLASVRAVADPAARGRGALVVLADQIHAARLAAKTHPDAPDAFASPGWGPMGRIEAEAVRWAWRPEAERPTQRPTGLAPGVWLIPAAVACGPEAIEAAIERNASGFVLETLGGGRVPPSWLEPIERAVGAGTAVAAVSRTGTGRLGDRYGYRGAAGDLRARGVRFYEGLNGPKGRIELMLALGSDASG